MNEKKTANKNKVFLLLQPISKKKNKAVMIRKVIFCGRSKTKR